MGAKLSYVDLLRNSDDKVAILPIWSPWQESPLISSARFLFSGCMSNMIVKESENLE
jgi:hypothetical protein